MLDEKLNLALNNWGLKFDPFHFNRLDAGLDPFVNTYFVNHIAFTNVIASESTFIFAPSGGGKSAFRASLARACRVNNISRRILPVVYTMPRPNQIRKITQSSVPYFDALNRDIAIEVLLTLAYKPEIYLRLISNSRYNICTQILRHFPGDLNIFLDQIESVGNLSPLIKLYDPTAEGLLSPPSTELLQIFCRTMRSDLPSNSNQQTDFREISPIQHFDNWLKLIKDDLKFNGIYILLDGINNYIKSTFINYEQVAELLTPLLRETPRLTEQQVYFKYFLPEEILSKLKFSELLKVASVVEMTWVRIEWDQSMLHELLVQRLFKASSGGIHNLSSICTGELIGIQDQLIEEGNFCPREILILAERLLLEHIWRVEKPDEIEQIDFNAAVNWYRKTQPVRE